MNIQDNQEDQEDQKESIILLSKHDNCKNLSKASSLFSKALVFGLLTWTSGAQASLLSIADAPLFLGATVVPNVMFVLDDSGSMDWEILTQPYNDPCMYDLFASSNTASSSDCGSVINDSSGYVYNSSQTDLAYLYNNNDNLYSNSCVNGDSLAVLELCTYNSKQTNEWRLLSSDVNISMYNPTSSYTPWNGPCTSAGAACTDASFTAARSNPREGTSGYTLTRNLSGTESYNVWIDDKGYSGTRPRRGTNVNVTTGANGKVDLWDSYVSIAFPTATTITVSTNVFTPTTTSMGKVTTLKATLSGSACYNILGSADTVRSIFTNNTSYTATDGAGCRTVAQAQTNIANWYQYNRKRSLMAKWAISDAIVSQPTWRYGLVTINNNIFIQMPASTVTDMTSFIAASLATLYSYNWQGYGTPLQTGLNYAGQYYQGLLSGKPSPIILSCQQNYSILMTDGFSNVALSSSVIGDVDGDGYSKTIADVAAYYYRTDLSSLANNVPPNTFDPATWQHMVTFTVAFGEKGNLVDTDGDGWPNPVLASNSNWGNPSSSTAANLDDLWHAAWNAKGAYVSASTPETFIAAIRNNFKNIASRVGSVSTVAQNSGTLSSSAAVYQSKFDSGNWIGDLLAYSIDATGVLATTPSWSAQCLLTGGACSNPVGSATAKTPDSRVIITRDWAFNGYRGIPFRFPTNYAALLSGGVLPPNMTSLLANAPYAGTTTNTTQIALNQAYGQYLVNYLRGDRTQEAGGTGTQNFRARTGILGDIINGAPTYVGPPSRGYPDSFETVSYSSFATTYANRLSMIYTGANDGMLHGFNAATGEEKIAYVPGAPKIYKNLPGLAASTLVHKYFVDGPPIQGDVFYGGAWHTLVAGGLRAGGQGVYALDVTNPANFTESNASSLLAFEFNDSDDTDLGYTFSDMRIVKMNNNKWALIFGNGYNNSESGTYASTTGRAAVYVLFIDGTYNGTWTLNTNYYKFLLGPSSTTTPNGISSVYPVDSNGDSKVDYLFASDIQGNIWKINVTDTNANNWRVSTASNTTPFFTAMKTTAGDQPITAPLIVSKHPTGVGFMIYFGTGMYIQANDNTTVGQTTQSIYGVWDKNDGTLPLKSNFVQQQILGQYTQTFTSSAGVNTTYQLRYTTSNPISWTSNTGWYMDLNVAPYTNNYGERVVTKAILRNGNVIFTTLIPSTDPCSAGGSSWLMELSSNSGSALLTAPFDLTGDSRFTTADFLNIGTSSSPNLVAPGGVLSASGLSATPTVFLSPDKTKEIKVISGTSGLKTVTENTNSTYLGRQNWRQLR